MIIQKVKQDRSREKLKVNLREILIVQTVENWINVLSLIGVLWGNILSYVGIDLMIVFNVIREVNVIVNGVSKEIINEMLLMVRAMDLIKDVVIKLNVLD